MECWVEVVGPENQLLKPEAKNCPTHYESPAPPPRSDHFWALSGATSSSVLLYFTSTEIIRTIKGRGAQDVHLDFHSS